MCFRRHCLHGAPELELSPSDNLGGSRGAGGGEMPFARVIIIIAAAYGCRRCRRHSLPQKLTGRHGESPLLGGRSSAVPQPSQPAPKPPGRSPAAERRPRGSPCAARLPGPAGGTAAPPRPPVPRCTRGSRCRPDQEVFPGPLPAGSAGARGSPCPHEAALHKRINAC